MRGRIAKPDTQTDKELYRQLDSNGIRHFVMVAGAGSGKTTSLVKALAHISHAQGKSLRLNGQQVACITYTDIAVEEIREDVGNDLLFCVSTIHSFLWTIIRPFQSDLRQWVIDRLKDKISEEQEKIDKPRTQQKTKERALENIERYNKQIDDMSRVNSFRYGTGSDYSNGVLGHSDILSIGSIFISKYALMRRVLVRRFPVIFIDESQDTDPAFVEALRVAALEVPMGFCLGFFGDPVQKIYMQGTGFIYPEEGWKTYKKPENFRCPQAVLRVINRIRAEDDGLEQIGGRYEILNGDVVPVEGTARVLILPADDQRQERLDKAREWLAYQDNDLGWFENEDENTLRILVLVHRMAANRLGFPNLYSSLNDKSPEDLKTGVVDGTAWVLQPFLNYVLPLLSARAANREFEIMQLLRKYCPQFQPEVLSSRNTADTLCTLQKDIALLVDLLEQNANVCIGEIATLLKDKNLISFDDRYNELLENYALAQKIDESLPDNAALRFMQCEAKELSGYKKYLEKLSPFATQQGIKGTEFNKVLVVVDDLEGKSPAFSYGKYFGSIPLSETDEQNIAENKDSVISRTRRLFYVCCSRALSDLAVVIFAEDTEQMRNTIIEKNYFDLDNVHVLP